MPELSAKPRLQAGHPSMLSVMDVDHRMVNAGNKNGAKKEERVWTRREKRRNITKPAMPVEPSTQ